jgi:hypothetical protein
MVSVTTERKQLQYAEPPPWHRRRWFRRVIAVAVLGVLAGSTVIWLPRLRHHLHVLHCQAWCMSYSPEPHEPVYIRPGPATLKALASGVPWSDIHPTPLGVPAQWSTLYGMISPPGLKSVGTAFLHARNAPGGEPRLVAVDIARLTSGSNGGGIVLTYRVVAPSSFGKPRLLASDEKEFPAPPTGSLVVYSGQPHSDDPSHFTILYEAEGGPTMIINGWLRSDDTVAFDLK